jgi:glutamine amidotransferase
MSLTKGENKDYLYRDIISIVDYGMGNIRSIQNALSFIGADSCVVDLPDEIIKSQKLILPGVGSFRLAMENIRHKKLLDALNEAVMVKNTPILGICLGMQLFADESEEDGMTSGLGWIPGSVRRLSSHKIPIKVPHMGFSTVYFESDTNSLFKRLPASADFYFAHSYGIMCEDLGHVSSWIDYGQRFAASVQKENIFGVQFHPEKSQSNGLTVLKNFCKLDREW